MSSLFIFAVCFSAIAQAPSKNVTLALTPKAQRDVSLHLKGALPSAKTPARAYLFPAPEGVAGTLAWTVLNDLPKRRTPDWGLYVARMGTDSDRMPRRFEFRVANKPYRARDDWQQGEASGLAVAPDGRSVIYSSEPETHREDSPEFFIEESALSELDLTTDKSRVLIGTKESRSDFSWSLDGRFLSYRGTNWRWPVERTGLGLSYEMSYPQAVLDLQTLRLVTEKHIVNEKLEFGHKTQWTRGERTVRVKLEADEYSEPGQRRSAQVTILNRLNGAKQGTFRLQGQLVEKTRSYQVRQIIEPLGLSSDGRYLFVRYGESDALKNQGGPLQITDQGVFAVDLNEKRTHLLASFKSVAEVAWRAK
jgi:hypothetical protein